MLLEHFNLEIKRKNGEEITFRNLNIFGSRGTQGQVSEGMSDRVGQLHCVSVKKMEWRRVEKREKRFYGKGAPKRFLIQKGKRRRVVRFRWLFLNGKSQIFWLFFSAIFLKNSVLSE